MDPLIGSVTAFAGNFAPKGWAFCDGAMLRVVHYPALYSIIGTIYGGDGLETFALPDLRGRVIAHFGQGSGLAPHRLADAGGAERVALTGPDMALQPVPVAAISTTAPGAGWPVGPQTGLLTARAVEPALALVNPLGDLHENRQPTLYLSYIIAIEGQFPQRP